MASDLFLLITIIIIIYIILRFASFRISVSRWSFSGVCVTASLLQSTLLSILADHKNTEVLDCIEFSSDFQSFLIFSNLFGTVPSAPTTIGITITLKFHFFLVLMPGSVIYLCFCFLLVLLCDQREQQTPLDG